MNSAENYKERRKAAVARGERCQSCGGYIIFPSGRPSDCSDCRSFSSEGRATHHCQIRCPACEHRFDIYDAEIYEALEEGTHTVACSECEHEFEIETRVTYTFASPPLNAATHKPPETP